ncbi:DUF881 domain-containing protein [Mycolicibacterium diernhoferi]|uniref:DUF881 domain-containing protein n=1 Tax=Mycolicibacterium diernhoferi TaxID=1801 RepID=A0A1Q4H9A7_9MYCO|nr:DUF881 domain-containing protein [Mycolicibacterium diernhoferi]OJZ63961.1 hypothetical protein BRW64_19705 [Mycolicibacterium diernhoferi]OPE56002.1 hypothetical protein BV510_02185 [Mycolicibacterium diernhoferi]PEG55654.1 DUF881 domain-containing protein [Mycolicibacterium diernhoferi]QYL20648.1 DUF881 domain-containing protein [Mycolicibacterium diernhoferi]
MTDPTSSLGGFRPDAGLNHHEAGAPQRIPVPSLLRSLLTDHLDPGYAAAAAKRTDPRAESLPARLRAGGWALLGGLTIAAVFAAAASQAQSVAPVNRHTQQVLADSVRAGETRTDAVEAHRDALATEVEAERRSRLAGDEQGRALLAALEGAEFAAAATPAIGPGVTVTVTDPGMSPDLSDVSKQRVAGSQQVILDRDLQLVVNSLWVGGAEAVSVGGARIGPNVTIRQAGGGILVDNRPITSPYEIVALGPPRAMQDVFNRSPGMQRLTLLQQSYGVGVTVSTGEALNVPGASVREIRFAKEIGR